MKKHPGTITDGIMYTGWSMLSMSPFEQWKQLYAPDDSGEDYDLLAAFHAGAVPDASGHWPDLFKKPNHPTFSVESIYATGDDAAKAGRWEGDSFVQPNGSLPDTQAK